MSDVYLLGAGFSKAISDEMPLLSELSGQIKKRGLDFQSPLTTLGDNLEVWLSYLSQPHPWLRESVNLKNQAMALEITEHIKEVLNEKERLAMGKDCPSWLQKLTKIWHETRAGVISLNYDTLVERAAGRIGTGGNEHLSSGQLYPVQLTLSTRRDGMVFGASEVKTFTLYKLHGSTNWYYSGAAESTGEVIYYTDFGPWGEDYSEEQHQRDAVSDKVPLIVPPTTEKVRFFQHESLKRVWTRAVISLSEAKTIFVIGYSLPMTDLAVRLFLHEGSRGNGEKKDLYIVNPDCHIVDRYRELLGEAYQIKDDYVGDNSFERLIDERLSPLAESSDIAP